MIHTNVPDGIPERDSQRPVLIRNDINASVF